LGPPNDGIRVFHHGGGIAATSLELESMSDPSQTPVMISTGLLFTKDESLVRPIREDHVEELL
jgi:hypothetical protein